MSKTARVRTRKRGKTYSYIFEAGRTLEGKRKVIEKGGYQTKQAAYDAGIAAYNDFKHGNIGITSEKIKLSEYMKSWLENVAALNVKPNSLQLYQSLSKIHIVPKLGNLYLTEITPAILDKWIRELQKSGYAKNTLNQLHALIHHALDYAVYPDELIQSNPAKYIRVPKKAPTNIIKRHIITQEQLTALLEKCPCGTPYYIPILILYHTGARLSEMLSLTWDDINFATKTITLHRQITYLQRRGYFFTTLKTETSNRYIIIDDYLLSELKRWQIRLLIETPDKTAEEKLLQQSKGLPFISGERVNLICTRDNGFAVTKANMVKLLNQNGINAHSLVTRYKICLLE